MDRRNPDADGQAGRADAVSVLRLTGKPAHFVPKTDFPTLAKVTAAHVGDQARLAGGAGGVVVTWTGRRDAATPRRNKGIGCRTGERELQRLRVVSAAPKSNSVGSRWRIGVMER